MTRTLPTLLLAAAFVAGGTWFLTRPGGGEESLEIGAAFAQDDAAEIDTSAIPDMVKGSADAPVTVIEYASFTCPHCATFHNEMLAEFEETYIDTGEVRMIYREVYFDLPGLWASMIARCGGEERFFGITEMIYERQRDWTQGDGAAIAESLRQIGLAAGLTGEQVDACFTDAEKAQTLIAWYEENAAEDNVTSTPSFVINGAKFEGNWSTGLMDAVAAAVGE
ncbi:DsbA family protein [Histidinibacterium lentulum]|uniref:DsbA family protein n=1 Tax=Histidinibacterium lentulum TaxID=2480588 RepID=A0A3N2R700_9RHOB|nr:DsbA family protein [Histidinibacterium lentulum]ROU03272.1 DsbA family protein [Histidinibacterium lentulum]